MKMIIAQNMDKTIKAGRFLSLKNTIGFIIIFYAVGVAGLSLDISREIFIRLMPFSLLLSLSLLFLFHHPWKLNHVVIFVLIAISSFFIEAAGVITGVIFGEYHYGNALGVKAFGTPLMIGINWLMLIYSVYVIFRNCFRLSAIPGIIAGAALMVLYDFVMEPVAMATDMWNWKNSQVPLQNYLAWFIISLVFLSLFHLFDLKYQNKLAPWLFVIQFLFFLSLNLIFIIT